MVLAATAILGIFSVYQMNAVSDVIAEANRSLKQDNAEMAERREDLYSEYGAPTDPLLEPRPESERDFYEPDAN